MFEHLISLVRKEEVTLFIGAGFSLEAHAPSVAMLKQAILNEISKKVRMDILTMVWTNCQNILSKKNVPAVVFNSFRYLKTYLHHSSLRV